MQSLDCELQYSNLMCCLRSQNLQGFKRIIMFTFNKLFIGFIYKTSLFRQKMKCFWLLTLLVGGLFFSGCSIHQNKYSEGYIDLYGKDLSQIEISDLKKVFVRISDKDVVYQNDFSTDFTVSFTPQKIDEIMVRVPQITCYAAYLNFPQQDMALHMKHVKCRYDEVVKYYVEKPTYYFAIGGDMPYSNAKEIVLAWYQKEDRWDSVDYIMADQNQISISVSGGACYGGSEVFLNSNGNIEFKKNKDMVCS